MLASLAMAVLMKHLRVHLISVYRCAFEVHASTFKLGPGNPLRSILVNTNVGSLDCLRREKLLPADGLLRSSEEVLGEYFGVLHDSRRTLFLASV